MNYGSSIEIRQMECFAACAENGSISKAAETLHMSQPSVSKAVKSMEEGLDVQLFKRYAKGIVLTEEGEAVYQYVKTILAGFNEMQMVYSGRKKDVLRLSGNPSSWFADTFLEFYMTHQGENLHYEIVPDEFSPDNYWNMTDGYGHSVESAETIVTTNSDYIMSRLLQSGTLSNISAAYLTAPQKGTVEGKKMSGLKEDKIIFGYVKRRGEELSTRAEEFAAYVKGKLEQET